MLVASRPKMWFALDVQHLSLSSGLDNVCRRSLTAADQIGRDCQSRGRPGKLCLSNQATAAAKEAGIEEQTQSLKHRHVRRCHLELIITADQTYYAKSEPSLPAAEVDFEF